MEEFEILTDDEKASSIRSKIKNVEFYKYNFELDILAENAASNPDASKIAEWQAQLVDLEAKKTVLKAELDNISN